MIPSSLTDQKCISFKTDEFSRDHNLLFSWLITSSLACSLLSSYQVKNRHLSVVFLLSSPPFLPQTFSLFYYLCLWVFWLHACLCTTHMPGAEEARRVCLIPCYRWYRHCKLPCGFWEFNPGPLEKQPNTPKLLSPLSMDLSLSPIVFNAFISVVGIEPRSSHMWLYC